MMNKVIQYQVGTPETLRDDAARLYDEAFGAKFSLAIPDQQKRLPLLADSLSLTFSMVAIAGEELVGLAGFQTTTGSLTKGMTAGLLIRHLGLWRGLWAAVVFGLYERGTTHNELLMDGIAVKSDMRGHGIGSTLIEMIKQYAHNNDYTSIRLDVIDTNSDAKRLYERLGFKPTNIERFGYLRWLLGFGGSTTMIFRVDG